MPLSWYNYGMIDLTGDWQFFPNTVLGHSLCAIEQFYSPPDPVGHALVRQQFTLSGGQQFTGRVYKLFGDLQAWQILNFEIPAPFSNQGIITQDISARIPRWTRPYSLPWSVRLYGLNQSLSQSQPQTLQNIQNDLLTVDLKLNDILLRLP